MIYQQPTLQVQSMQASNLDSELEKEDLSTEQEVWKTLKWLIQEKVVDWKLLMTSVAAFSEQQTAVELQELEYYPMLIQHFRRSSVQQHRISWQQMKNLWPHCYLENSIQPL